MRNGIMKVMLLALTLLLLACAGKTTAQTPAETEKPMRYRIACLGDSITEGVGVENKENLYVNKLSEADFIIKAQNVGSSGTTIALPPDTALRSLAFVNRYKQIDDRAALIFVFGGTNDYQNDVPIGTKDSTDSETFYGALHTLIDGLRTGYPNAKLLFATPLQRDDAWFGSPSSSPYNAEGLTLSDYRDAILAVCEAEGIECLDLYSLEGMRPGDPTFREYFADGLHPNDAGSSYISGPILEKIREMLGA